MQNFKMTIKTVLLTLFLSQFVMADEPLMCRFDKKTKSYLQNDFNKGYPRKVIYQCGYICLNSLQEKVNLLATHTVQVHSTEAEARGTLCRGVTLKEKKWGFVIDKVQWFYAHSSKLSEIKSWAQQQGRNSLKDKALLQQLTRDLDNIILSYSIAAKSSSQVSSAFTEAAENLRKIQSELKSNKVTSVQDWLKRDVKKMPRDSAEHLTYSVLSTQAHWL